MTQNIKYGFLDTLRDAITDSCKGFDHTQLTPEELSLKVYTGVVAFFEEKGWDDLRSVVPANSMSVGAGSNIP